MKAARWFWIGWILALAGTWFSRPPLPPDELRYLSVSWEMWDTGSLLVPVLNGAPYSHKPPLLFWGHQLGWKLFGVNAWWPRLMQAAGAALVLLLLARLARALAPRSPQAPACALLLYGGGLIFQLYSGSILFDLWLTCFVLLSWLGLLRACPAEAGQAASPRSGWLIFSLATAAALLTKGPAAFLSILPPALLLPLWAPPRSVGKRAWLGLAVAVLAACGLTLAWALPAARAGGAEYGNAILYGQTAGRLHDSFAHARPFWWYLALLPAMTLPWTFLPALWHRRPPSSGQEDHRALARFGLCAFLPALLLFSAVSGKQPHYLFSALGGLVLLATARLAPIPQLASPAFTKALFGIGALCLAALPPVLILVGIQQTAGSSLLMVLTGAAGAAFLGLAAFRFGRRESVAPNTAQTLGRLALFFPIFFLALHLILKPVFLERYSWQEPATAIASAQAEGRPTAFFGATYHGHFHFLGRLHAPVANPASALDQRKWLKENPNGLVALLLDKESDPRLRELASSVQISGTRHLALWRAADLAPLLEPYQR